MSSEKSSVPSSPHVMNTYGRLPVALSHGQGCRVWDTEGRDYLDALGGIAVNTVGLKSKSVICRLRIYSMPSVITTGRLGPSSF